MERITIDEASRDLGGLIDSLASRGITIEVERDECVIATIVPVKPTPPHICRTMNDFAELLNSLPSLGDDSEAFERDIAEMRNFYLPEVDAWQ